MRKIFYIFFLLLFAIPLGAQNVIYEEGKIHIKLNPFTCNGKPGDSENLTPAIQKILDENQAVSLVPLSTSFPELSDIYTLTFLNTQNTEQLINALRLQPEINYATRIPVPTAFAFTPNDLNGDIMWYFKRIQMQESWNYINTGTRVTIAIVDNGVRVTHEDIQDNLWRNPGEIPNNGIDDDNNGYVDDINGYDVADADNNPNVPSHATNTYFTHGTHVAGLASASTGNSTGTVSVGINTSIIAVKVVKDNENDALYSAAYDGILYAVAAGAQIINISWGAPAFNPAQKAIIELALRKGCIIVAAAGNDNTEQPRYPAAFPGVIAVGSTDNNDKKANTSNFGNYISVMAPGINMYSTLAGNDKAYGIMSGTSQSAPIVSGFAGLLLSQYPEIKDSIEYFIRRGCDNIDLDNWDYNGMLGAGRINVDRTFALIKNPALAVNKVIQEDIHVYPNPSSGHLFFQGPLQVETIEIYDLSGKLILNKEVNDQQVDLYQSSLKGLYIVKITGQSGSAVSRIVFH